MMLRSLPCFMIVALLAGPATLAAQPAPDSQALTPGRAALLVGRNDPEYRAELRAAIASPDPVVRAVAARVAGVRRQGDMEEPLKTALAAETDPIASREHQRALDRLRHPPSAAADPAGAAPIAVRTFPLVVPGLLSSLMQAAGCKPTKEGSFGAAQLKYDSSGAVTHSQIDPAQLSTACAAVLGTMARLTVADAATSSSTHSEYLLLPIDRDFVACADAAIAAPGETKASGVTKPQKIRDVKPIYPPRALEAGRQGAVLILAHVTSAGCINDARVTRGLDPAFDFAALQAVVQWRFQPARLNGRPVPSLMTVAVSFALR